MTLARVHVNYVLVKDAHGFLWKSFFKEYVISNAMNVQYDLRMHTVPIFKG